MERSPNRAGWVGEVDPIPETTRAYDLYGPFLFQGSDLLDRLVLLGDEVQSITPTCVGLSFSLGEECATFTVVSPRGPPSPAPTVPVPTDRPGDDILADPLEEEAWTRFAVATSHGTVLSTLSLPVRSGDLVTGAFTLHASTTTAFDGLHAELASLLGAWAGGAVTNSDLDFSTRDVAREAPEALRESTRLTLAAGLLAQATTLSVEGAKSQLRETALRAEVPLPELVDSLIETMMRAH